MSRDLAVGGPHITVQAGTPHLLGMNAGRWAL